MSSLYFDASAVAGGAGLQGNKGWPEFDFRRLPLSKDARAQLANNYDYVRVSGLLPKGKRKLLDAYISNHAFDAGKGLYLPLADRVKIPAKFSKFTSALAASDTSSLLVPSRACFFGNALLMPENFGEPGFNLAEASKPVLRVTNAGFLVTTLEIDCKNRKEFEQNLAWTGGKDNDFRNSDFAQVDATLCRFKDYRGHCIVFTGNRSLHFHLIFATDHLLNCPADALSEARWGEHQRQQAVLMQKAHEFYWDRAVEIFRENLSVDIEFDRALRGVTQWRRTPWALRTLEKDSAILDLPEGTVIPQLVLHEDIRGRASPASKDGEYCVPATFSVANPGYAPRISRSSIESAEECCLNLTPVIADVQKMCASEWGSVYPQPVSMTKSNGQWLIKFRNHAGDKNPSTIVQGHHRKLLLAGSHSFGHDASFLLPDELTANELGDYLAVMHGLVAASSAASNQNSSVSDPEQAARGGVDLAALRLRSKKPLTERISETIERRFRAPIMAEADAQKQAYRENLGQAVRDSRVYAGRRSILIKSAEGIGKSSSHVNILLDEAFDRAVHRKDSPVQRFSAFAFRSRDQAETKAAEVAEVLRERGCAPHRQTFVVKTFWDHYEGACLDAGIRPIAKDDFEKLTLDFILAKVEAEQPRVYELLEERRKALWADTRFDAGTVILFMTHKAAQLWQESEAINRVWHHPKFKPGIEGQEKLADEFQLADVVFDDPEADDFYHLLPESVYDFLTRQKEKLKQNPKKEHHDWRRLDLSDRRDIYQRLKEANEIPGRRIKCFDEFDELMRLDLETLAPITVDFNEIPYGQDNPKARGLYRPRHGNLYYIGVKPWLSKNFFDKVFLTTEDGVANVIEKAIGKSLFRLDLDEMPGLFPISVPLCESKRAKADEKGKKLHISALAADLRNSHENAIIVGNGIETSESDDTFTFQKVKGLNGLEDQNLFIIVTWLHHEEYAKMNVLGQWLGKKDLIDTHYRDQINQAVGRNRGFRQSESETKTVVIASPSLWKKFLFKFMVDANRVRLYQEKGPAWL